MRDYPSQFNANIDSNGRMWEQSSIYNPSTQSQNEKNVLAMNNSTDQLLKTQSNNLMSTSANPHSLNRPLAMEDFHQYDNSNQFKTSYHLMDNMSIPSKDYYIPKYTGFVPGMKSQNPFGSTFTKASREQLDLFDKRQLNQEVKESIYNPISKTIGAYYNNNNRIERSYGKMNEPYDFTLNQSGYSINLLAKSPAGIICPTFIEPPENHKTEYGSQFNRKPSFHYKCPLYSTGILKQSNSKLY